MKELQTPKNGETTTTKGLQNPNNGEPTTSYDHTISFEDFDSACSTPYVSAPSSPGRAPPIAAGVGGFFYSAPTSPMHFLLSASSLTPTSSSIPREDLEEFDFSASWYSTTRPMSSADELFLNGKIRPQKLAPLLDVEESRSEEEEYSDDNGGKIVRGRREMKSRNRSLRKIRSMSPLRTTSESFPKNDDKIDDTMAREEHAPPSGSSLRLSSVERNSKRWVSLKELLYRRGRNNGRHKYFSVKFTLSDFLESGRIPRTQLATNVLPVDGTDSWSKTLQFMLSSWVDSDGILFNTVEEIDKTGLDYFPRKLSLSVWPIGPIYLLVDTRARSGKKYGVSSESCINWLDLKPQNSVLYISFGSQNTISASQMMQLAKALDSIEMNFIWVVRPPLEFDINLGFDTEEWLPEGFIKRIEDQNKGLIIVKWAPQVEILSHRAVAAFLSHCGWNSVLESLSGGVPLIGWPMGAEQFYNVKYLEEEVGVCVEVARGTTFEVRSEDIVKKIGIVMGENGKGKEMREKADQLKKMIENGGRDEEGYKGSSVKAMEEFLSVAASFWQREGKN